MIQQPIAQYSTERGLYRWNKYVPPNAVRTSQVPKKQDVHHILVTSPTRHIVEPNLDIPGRSLLPVITASWIRQIERNVLEIKAGGQNEGSNHTQRGHRQESVQRGLQCDAGLGR